MGSSVCLVMEGKPIPVTSMEGRGPGLKPHAVGKQQRRTARAEVATNITWKHNCAAVSSEFLNPDRSSIGSQLLLNNLPVGFAGLHIWRGNSEGNLETLEQQMAMFANHGPE